MQSEVGNDLIDIKCDQEYILKQNQENILQSDPNSESDTCRYSSQSCETDTSNAIDGGSQSPELDVSQLHYAQTTNQLDSRNQSSEPEQLRKLFIGGLDYGTSEETLKKHFEKFGKVTDCVVMREPQSKRSRGFGFVIYANSKMVDQAQRARPHEVDGREVQSKRAISREDSGRPETQATVKKVYLGGLSDDIEEFELRDYFKEFGNIVNINIVAHKDTGKRRGFAFVEYDDYDPVDKIVLQRFHSIRDKRVEAKKAIPKTEMDARRRIDPRAGITAAMLALSAGPIDAGPGMRFRGGGGGRGIGSACQWDGPYGGYPGSFMSAGLDGYPHHGYNSPPAAHYGANWMMQNGAHSYAARGSHGLYGRGGYANNQHWFGASEYNCANLVGSYGSGGTGPIRLGHQHRGWGPYGTGYGSHRGRGHN